MLTSTISLLIQIGDHRYAATVHLDEADQAVAEYTEQMAHLPSFREFHMASAAIVASRMMSAAMDGRHWDVAAAGWWLVFKRPGEERGNPARQMLERTIRETGGARVILVTDEVCSLDSVHIHVAALWTPETDPRLDLRPRLSRKTA
ncbi:hypothetical protein GGE65_007663 [Skermanella aerolata]|uniref:hypothetical protein n=1 Tax=Skermanella aerolata TaxID=393310 RepID=UPI003D1F6D4B